MEKSISIVVPTYNRLKYLKKILPSYLKQDNVKEVIIIDDNSSDGTKKFIKNNYNNDVKYIRLNKNVGAPKAKQIGVENSTGEYILFGEDDVYFSKNYSKVLLEHLIKNDADIIGGRIIYLKSGQTKEEVLKINNYKSEKLYDKYLNNNFNTIRDEDEEVLFLHACYLIKRNLFNEIKYDDKYLGNAWREETDLLIQAKKNNNRIIFCPHTHCFHLFRANDKGGQHYMSKFKYEYWVYKNNLYFFNKHNDFLKKNNIIKFSPFIDNLIHYINRFYKKSKSKIFRYLK